MEIKDITVGKTVFKAVEIDLCENGKLIAVTGKKGYVMCGYLNINTAQKRGEAACIVTGVKTIEDVLNADVVALTAEAQKLGIEMGMPVKEVLKKLS